MKREQRTFWTWAPVVALFLLGAVYHVAVVSDLQSTVDELERTTGALNADVASINGQLEERTAALDEKINQSVDTLTRDLEAQEERSLSQIRGIEGQIGDIQEQSEDIEDQIVNMNLQSDDLSGTVDETLQSVVSIVTDTGAGSGTIVDPDGYIVTNYHVVAGITQGAVKTYDGQLHAMRIVATDAESDLALLQIDTDDNLRALSFEPSENVRAGMRVIALGSPAGLEFTVTEGIVSAARRDGPNGVPYIQTDVPINPGNSGGPLVNVKGNLVGINTLKARGFEGLGFAIEGDAVEEFVRAAIDRDEGVTEQLAE